MNLILNKNRLILRKSFIITLIIAIILNLTLPIIILDGIAFPNKDKILEPSQHTVTIPLTNRFKSDVKLSKGKFLVASKNLIDPNFSETVILLLDYSVNGAIGLIINRPADVKLSRLLPEIKDFQNQQDTVYIGGPVALNHMLLLIQSGNQAEQSSHVFDDIYVSSSRKVLKMIVANVDSTSKFHAYVGYAGWAPGQLDSEVLRGDWYVLQADAETVFDKPPLEIWPELNLLTSGQWVIKNEKSDST